MPIAVTTKKIHYPESDGKPMAETDLHRQEMVREINALELYFAGQKVYVSGNILVYYVEGNPKKCFSPDVMVAKGLQQKARRTYQFWRERVVPQVVIEVTSNKTKRQDQHRKPQLYAELGIREFFLFDPTEDYLNPQLQGFRLVDGEYVRIAMQPDGSLISQELELRLIPNEDQLVFYRLDNGARLLTSEEGRLDNAEKLAQTTGQLAATEGQLAVREGELGAAREQLAQTQDKLSVYEAEIARLREELKRAAK